MITNSRSAIFRTGNVVYFGHICVLSVMLVFFLWATMVPLAESSLAQGSVTVGSERQIISHVDGGKIDELFVSSGDLVHEGQVLLKFDDTALQTELNILRYQLYARHAAIDRLRSERKGIERPEFRQSLLDAADEDLIIRDLIEGEKKNFLSRRDGLRIETALIEHEIEQAGKKQEKLQLQINSMKRQIIFVEKQINNNEKLISQGYGKRATLIDLKRDRERIITQRLSLEGQIEESRAISDSASLKRNSLSTRYINESQKNISQHYENQGQIEEKIELIKLKISNTTVHSDVDGVVVDVHFRSKNDVVRSASPIIEIVPRNSTLLVEASVPPYQIEGIFEGANVEVRFPAFANGDVPSTEGEISLVSADIIIDDRNSFYRVHVAVKNWEKIAKIFDVIPGMPVEIIINKRRRTLMNYLLGVLSDNIAKSFL